MQKWGAKAMIFGQNDLTYEVLTLLSVLQML